MSILNNLLVFLFIFLLISSYNIAGIVISTKYENCNNPNGNDPFSLNLWLLCLCYIMLCYKFIWTLTIILRKHIVKNCKHYDMEKSILPREEESSLFYKISNPITVLVSIFFTPAMYYFWYKGIYIMLEFGWSCNDTLYAISVINVFIMMFEFVQQIFSFAFIVKSYMIDRNFNQFYL
jgi:hypothetical protein